MAAIRAIYEDGHLRLLDPFNLKEGAQVQVTIVPDREQLKAIFGDTVQWADPSIEFDPEEEAALMKEIEEGYKGRPLSEIIIEEREQGR